MITKYCDFCEQPVVLTEEGYCSWCGKHADNMKDYHHICSDDDINKSLEDYYEQGSQSVEIDEFTKELLNDKT